MTRGRRCWLAVLALALGLASTGPTAAGNGIDAIWKGKDLSKAVSRKTYKGVEVIALPLPKKNHYGVKLLPPKVALNNVMAALKDFHAKSPFAVGGLERLQKYGKVKLVYDATFPEKSLTGGVIAGYVPFLFQPQDGRRDFVVVIGRFGVKWKTGELAAVLVHELIGHGLQRLDDRIGVARPIDLECEARLWQQRYFEDAGIPQDTRFMVGFRRATDRRFCGDFRRYLAASHPTMITAWDRGRPDIPELLKIFRPYSDAAAKAARARRAEKGK